MSFIKYLKKQLHDFFKQNNAYSCCRPLHIAIVHENFELVKRFIDIMANSGKTVDRFNKLQQVQNISIPFKYW